MNYSKPRPVSGQVWAFSAFGEIQEIILLTRIMHGQFYGILLFTTNGNLTNLFCKEIGAATSEAMMTSDDCWSCLT